MSITLPSKDKIYGVYVASKLTTKISLHITQVGKHTKTNLEDALNRRMSNKCVEEGYIRPKSIRIQTFSAGTVRSEYVDFHVIYDCLAALPVEGQVLECTVKTVTKAGIHAQCVDKDGNIPITVFVARDHHQNEPQFAQVKELDTIYVGVIGVRYELNDPYICVISKFMSSAEAPRRDKLEISRESVDDAEIADEE